MSISPDPAGLSSPAQHPAFVDAKLAVRRANAVGEEWIVTKVMKYKNFTAPDGSRSDFASVPRFLVWLIPRYGRYTKSAVLHDHLCRSHEVKRVEADRIFRESMADLDVAFLRRWLMLAGVRAGSGLSGATWHERCIWLLIALPAAAFVFVPAVVILVWLGMFWLIELVFFAAFKLAGRTRPNRPRLLVKL